MSLVSKLLYKTSKGVANFTAPLAALASTAGDGGKGYLDNLAAVYHVPLQLYHIGKAYVTNEGIRDFLNNRVSDLVSIVTNSAENIVERPVETVTAAAGVYFGVKYLPHLIKGASKILTRTKTTSL
jgi:hypothetical protein